MTGPKLEFLEEILHSEEPVLVDFFAEWCGPCMLIFPELEQFVQSFQGKLKFVRVDIERHPQASLKYTIHHIPTLVLFHKGKILWRQNGAIPISVLERDVRPLVA